MKPNHTRDNRWAILVTNADEVQSPDYFDRWAMLQVVEADDEDAAVEKAEAAAQAETGHHAVALAWFDADYLEAVLKKLRAAVSEEIK